VPPQTIRLDAKKLKPINESVDKPHRIVDVDNFCLRDVPERFFY
jgi:hypothetical protein